MKNGFINNILYLTKKLLGATIPTPDSGDMALFFNSTGSLMKKDSNGVESSIGGSAADISVNTENFSKNLSQYDTTVQDALETLDQLSSGGTLPFATVGNSAISGADGDYTTIKAAIDAGHYNIQIVGGTSETANIIFAATTILQINGDLHYTSTFTNSCLDFSSSTNYKAFINNCSFICTYDTFNSDIGFIFGRNSSINELVILYNCDITLTKANINQCNSWYSDNKFKNEFIKCRITLGNTGLSNNVPLNRRFIDCVITGGGTSCVIYLSYCDKTIFLGTYSYIYIIGILTDSDFTSATLGAISLRSEGYETIERCKFNGQYINTIWSGAFTETKKIISCTGFRVMTDTPNIYAKYVKFIDCKLDYAVTIDSNCEIINCKTNGITCYSSFNKIEGGEHTTIAINGNNNIVEGTRKATSITLGAVTGCIITGNQCDNDITLVAGNEITNNITY